MKKNEKYLVIICIVAVCITFFLGYIIASGKISKPTNKCEMEVAVTVLGLFYSIFVLDTFLICFIILIVCDNSIKRKSLSLRTKFNLMSLIYFILMIAICTFLILTLIKSKTDAKDYGEAIIEWWFLLSLFVPSWLGYFILCGYITKSKLNQRIDLLIGKSIKSCLIGIAAWSALFFNLKILVKSPEFLNYFKYFCILGCIFQMFYPLLDMYEYTILEIKETLY